jgi:hypothetical protein
MEFNREIIEHYSRGGEEKRLDGISLEKIRSQDIIMRHIPEPPAIVLDIGGAHGVYSFWLSQKGYEVHLIDITPLHIDQANKYSENTGVLLSSVIIGDARELPYSNNSFDIVPQHRNETKNDGYFTTAFFHHPEELKEEIKDAGFESIGLFAVDGFARHIPNVEKKCEDKEYLKMLLDILQKVECDASMLGVSCHFIGIGRKL